MQKKIQPTKKRLLRSLKERNTIVSIIAGLVVVVGAVQLYMAQAAGPTTSIEPESSGVQGSATVVNDSAASGGKGVRFTSTSPGKLLQPYGLGFAPYAYIPWQGSMSSVQSSVNNKHFMAAFVIAVGNSCTPAWDGEASLGLNSARGNAIGNDINTIRSRGGDVVVSFGGAGGTELAVACTSTTNLKQAYKAVIDRYNLTMIDLDIEGGQAGNAAANARRADALLALQKEKPSLKIWMTLQVMQSGMVSQARSLVTQMRDKGVVLSGINIMVMDYGTNEQQMGQAAIRAANGTFGQLKQIYPGSSDAEIWKSIGLTAMIGINDTRPETFTLANAREMKDFAVQKGIGMLSYWNTDRDKSCPGNAPNLSDSCSGVTQTPWQFAKTLLIQPAY